MVGIRTLKFLSAFLRPLSLALQERGMNLTSALHKVDSVVDALKHVREDVVDEFKAIFSEVKAMAEQLGFSVVMPRVTTISKYRASATFGKDDVESYFRVTVFIPALEAVIQDIIDLFTSHQRAAYTLGVLLPSRAQAETWQTLKPSYDKYTHVR